MIVFDDSSKWPDLGGFKDIPEAVLRNYVLPLEYLP